MNTPSTDHALYDPERQFLGCLMWLPLNSARRVLAGMRASDLADPMAAHVLQLAIEVLADGQPPTPVALFAHAVATGRAPGESRRAWLGKWLADTYGADCTPTLASHLKAVVLEAAWRRAIRAHALQLLQAVEHSPTDVLLDVVDDREQLNELWTRYQHAVAAGPNSLEVAA